VDKVTFFANVVDAGEVDVVYGSAAGLSITARPPQNFHQATINIDGDPDVGDRFGASLTAGNFGRNEFDRSVPATLRFDDLAIGVPYEDVSGVLNAGAVSVIYGSPGCRRSPRSRSSAAASGRGARSAPGPPRRSPPRPRRGRSRSCRPPRRWWPRPNHPTRRAKAQVLRRLLDRQAAKVAELDNPRPVRRDRRQARQRVVKGNQVHPDVGRHVEGTAGTASAAPCCRLAADLCRAWSTRTRRITCAAAP